MQVTASSWNVSQMRVTPFTFMTTWMAHAIPGAFVDLRIAARHPTALLGEPIPLPQARKFDTRRALGGAWFDIGWGLAGMTCPSFLGVLACRKYWQVVIF